jgi:GT2 family glycosyltransferase
MRQPKAWYGFFLYFKNNYMVYVIVLNWKGAADTIECANSVLSLQGTPFRLVICDNASGDDSIPRLRQWAAGQTTLTPATTTTQPATEFMHGTFDLIELSNEPKTWQHSAALAANAVVLIQTGANLGYAGGNNVGMRYAFAQGDADHVWVLNNDTTVTPDALNALVKKAATNPELGIIGSTLLFHYRPGYVQVLGGCSFAPWSTRVAPVGWGKTAAEAAVTPEHEVEAQMDYVAGASMLVSKAFITDIGLMQEDYFLYFEEIDWALRGLRNHHSWKLGFARDSVVIHKVGASAGTGTSVSATRYYYTSKLRFMKRFYPKLAPITWLMVLMQAVKSVFKGHPEHLPVILSVLARSGQISAAGKPPRIND